MHICDWFNFNKYMLQGGYMAAKRLKFAKQFAVSSTESGIFDGVAIFVNGYTGSVTFQ